MNETKNSWTVEVDASREEFDEVTVAVAGHGVRVMLAQGRSKGFTWKRLDAAALLADILEHVGPEADLVELWEVCLDRTTL